MSGSKARGDAAEAFVAGRLESQGYRILATNYRARRGEIDIVALDGGVLVFVEVKQRTGERYVSAEEALTAAQIARIMRTAGYFVAAHPEYAEHLWRLDLVAITLDGAGVIRRYRHIENVVVE